MSDPLAPVSALYARREATALSNLALARRNEEAARNDLERLRALGEEYRASLVTRSQDGLPADSLKHLRGFLAQLDRGIAVQSQQVGKVAERTTQCEQGWQDAKVRTHAIDAVRVRRQLLLQRHMARREQHSQDELAMRRRAGTGDIESLD